MLPNFIGIGAPRAGTTWLFENLREHPEIFLAAVKETNFFDYATSIDGRLEEYEEHFVKGAGAVAVGEISTRYLTSYRAPERIKMHIPNARLFVSLRNPVEQVYSHYWHLLKQNFHQWGHTKVVRSFEEALQIYEAELLEPAFYYKHLRRWLQYFDRSQLLVIFYDDIRDRPEEVLRTVCCFLSVGTAFTPRSINQIGSSTRQGRSPKSPILARIHSFLYDQLNRNIYHRLKQAVGTRTAIQVMNTVKIRALMEHLFLQKGYPEMSSQTRAFLRKRFSEDVQKLANLTGRDLRHWE